MSAHAYFVPMKEVIDGEFRRQEMLTMNPTAKERAAIKKALDGYTPQSLRCNSYEAAMFRRLETDPTQQW